MMNIVDLPHLVLDTITSYLPPVDLFYLSQTCRTFVPFRPKENGWSNYVYEYPIGTNKLLSVYLSFIAIERVYMYGKGTISFELWRRGKRIAKQKVEHSNGTEEESLQRRHVEITKKLDVIAKAKRGDVLRITQNVAGEGLHGVENRHI